VIESDKNYHDFQKDAKSILNLKAGLGGFRISHTIPFFSG
jgi:hypothetical protein